MSDRCDRCFKSLADGEHGVGLCPLEPRSRATAIVADDIPGGMVIENGFKTPQTFYSKSAYEQALRDNGLTRIERFCPTPGTDIDPAGVQNPKGYMDPQTLENARVLVTRVKQAVREDVETTLMIRGHFNISGEKDAVHVAEGTSPTRQSRIGRRLKNATRPDPVDTGGEHPAAGEGCNPHHPTRTEDAG